MQQTRHDYYGQSTQKAPEPTMEEIVAAVQKKVEAAREAYNVALSGLHRAKDEAKEAEDLYQRLCVALHNLKG